MIPTDDPMLQHLFREQDEPIDFAKIAKAAATPLSPEARKVLTTNEPDFHEMMTCFHFGLPLPASSTGSSFSKSTTSASLAKRFIEENGVTCGAARHALGHITYYSKHMGEEGVGLTERLQTLVERASLLLSPEDSELLRKAAAALDMYLVAYFFEKAFVGV